jgi:hypothetical protein
MRQATPIILTDEQRAELERRLRSQTMGARSVRRDRIILLAADGTGIQEIAGRLEISRGACQLGDISREYGHNICSIVRLNTCLFIGGR